MEDQKNMSKKTIVAVVVIIVLAIVVGFIKYKSDQQAASITAEHKWSLLPSQRGEKGQAVSASKITLKNLPKFVGDPKLDDTVRDAETSKAKSDWKDDSKARGRTEYAEKIKESLRWLNYKGISQIFPNSQTGALTAIDSISDNTGSPFSGSRPPDTQGAVGPNHLVSTVNRTLTIQTKVGTLSNTVSLASIFSSVLPNPNIYVPILEYDSLNLLSVF